MLQNVWLMKIAGEELINKSSVYTSSVKYGNCTNKCQRKYSCSGNCFLIQRKNQIIRTSAICCLK